MGILTVTNSTIAHNWGYIVGGGIDNVGTLTLANSTVASNSSPLVGGGGIWSEGMLTLANSTSRQQLEFIRWRHR